MPLKKKASILLAVWYGGLLGAIVFAVAWIVVVLASDLTFSWTMYGIVMLCGAFLGVLLGLKFPGAVRKVGELFGSLCPF